ncbi:putative glycosyl hydrolase YIR007W [Ceratocystis fimbriata CBS 114723]|uniref:Putative glycosyl hydrolase YIR007W n=1 Tax=Ceratocystis fimbriata CBS 114723 TaxID=1035309 RepID=A0A2C5WYG9_9PEZI|nr:putative glycosyl hydrolase YIR007W [Ceratocystis fimbriata CBS 114723]
MSQFRLTIEDGQFRDGYGRQVVLRGINCAGDAKLPSTPKQTSYDGEDFFDGDNVKFHQRPFPLSDAHEHLGRIRRHGYNTLRYVFTWEAIEAAGPGIYDEEWIQHTIEILRVAKQYGFFIFMDPHQDVWARFCGGSGAPLWTIYACGLNPQSFAATEAAIVQNVYPDPDGFPKMIWSTNYWRLAAATIFTLFFGGRDFAPKCIINGINIQDFLQGHFIAAVSHLNRRIREAGDLHNVCVVGWESMNEPNRGLVGYQDICAIPKEHPLKKGTCPTIWQAILTGSGRSCEIDVWAMGGMGPYKTGTRLVDPRGEKAWLPVGYDESRYKYTRDPGWKLGECLWAQHGVWDPETDTVLRKDYFSKNPRTGKRIDHPEFTDTYFMDFWRLYKAAVRREHPDCIVLMQFPTLELPPRIKGTADEDPKMGFTPHFYDGITLMTKKWNRTWNLDVVGFLRGRYLHPAFALRIGEKAIRNCFRDQLACLRQEGIDRMGNHPCVLSEFGIPYDMDEKHAYKTGDYSSQLAALDANYYGVESSLLEGHCLWVYTAISDHARGDQWNGEDLSIFSLDDKPLPVSSIPRSSLALDSNLSLTKANDDATASESEDGASAPATSLLASSSRRATADEARVIPTNLRQSMASPPPMSSSASSQGQDPSLTNAPGYRAAEAFLRPTPMYVVGNILQYGFDLRSCTFKLKLKAPAAARAEAPTIIFLPEFHFPRDSYAVEVSSGKWQVSVDDGEGDECEQDSGSKNGSSSSQTIGEGGALLQKLRWWHQGGEQSIKITGLVRKFENLDSASEDTGYMEQCQNSYNFGAMSACTLM